MSERAWYYLRQGERLGPVGTEALRQVIASGQLTSNELVWSEGMSQWAPAHSVGDLWAGGPPPPPPLPPMQYYGAGPYAAPPPMGNDAGMRMLLPVGRSGWAIAAGYLGLFSVLMIPAPFALLCAIMGIRSIRRDKNVHGMGRAIFGLIMGLVGTIGLIVMLVAMASDSPARGRRY
jgi:hypothetical protein